MGAQQVGDRVVSARYCYGQEVVPSGGSTLEQERGRLQVAANCSEAQSAVAPIVKIHPAVEEERDDSRVAKFAASSSADPYPQSTAPASSSASTTVR